MELLSPSLTIYLNTSRIGNAVVLRNDLGQFSALFGRLELGRIRLPTALSLLAERGANVRLVYSASPSIEEEFLSQLSARVQHRRVSAVQHHGMFTEHFCLSGSLTFADFSVDVAGDQLDFTNEPAAVTRALLAARQYWEDLE